MKTLAERVRTLRRQRGLTQDDLARLAGVRVLAISNIEKNKTKKPQTDTIQGIAREFGVSVDWLLNGNEAPTPTTSEPVDDNTASPGEELLERVISDVGLDEDLAAKLRATRWTGGLPSEGTLRSYALDLVTEKRREKSGQPAKGPEPTKPEVRPGAMRLKGKRG